MRITTDVENSFETHSFPTTTADIIEQYGHLELALPNGSVTLGEVLDHLPNERLETEEDARLTTYGALGEDAIGRKGYSDRDPFSMGERGHEHQSL